MSSFLKVREIKSSCFLFYFFSDVECLSLPSKAVFKKKKKKAEIVLGSSYQPLFTKTLAEAKVYFAFFYV